MAGGNGGLGKAIGKRFIDEGAAVLISARSEKSLVAAAAEIGADYAVSDICSWQDCRSLAEQAAAKYGCVDIAVNSAGFEGSSPILDLDPQQVESLVAVHFTGPLYFMQHMAHAMSAGGSLIYISSLTATLVAETYAAYAGAKAGMNHASRIAASELAARGIRSNVISPSLVETPMVEEVLAMPGVRAATMEQTPLAAMPQPEDVADAALWLASDESRFVTGQNILVDAGVGLMRLPRTADIIRHAAIESES